MNIRTVLLLIILSNSNFTKLVNIDDIVNENLIQEDSKNSPDLTIIGFTKFNDGLGRIPIGIVDCLKDCLTMNLIPTKFHNYSMDEEEINEETLKVIKKNNLSLGKIVLITEGNTTKNYIRVLNKNHIRILYSMFESSQIPKIWVDTFNNFLDAIVVPDIFLVDVYKNSGVKIPIFVLPLGLYLEEFTKIKKNHNDQKKFYFGCMASFQGRKNQDLLIEAFYKEFRNNKNVILKLNGRSFLTEKLKHLIKKLNLSNIEITNNALSWKNYIDFMLSLNCYVSISKGEGYSIPPREALAAKIPCILTNNSGQRTLCYTDYFKVVKSNIPEPATDYEGIFPIQEVGFFFNCTLSDVRSALKEVYLNYDLYLKKAQQGQLWVLKEYSWKSLKSKYLNLVKPKKIILGNENIITDDFLMTDSESLYKKYVIATSN